MPLSYRTAGESHGPALIALVEGLPAGVELDVEFIDGELRRRQGGYGRGGRQRIESDRATFLSGVRRGKTIGSPIAIEIKNADSRIDDLERTPPVHRPRPGHADLAGSLKWLTTDCRETLERASARETAARVAAGAVARVFLRALGIEVFGFVRSTLDVRTEVAPAAATWKALREARDASEVYCPDAAASAAMVDRIHRTKAEKDTAGGLVEAHVFGCPPGLGSCMRWEDRLDARLAGAVMGVQAFKSVEIGLGRECAARPGSQVHDPIAFDPAARQERHLGFARTSNNAGGLEGGMTNGMPVVVVAAMKPIATLGKGMPSVDLVTKADVGSQYERSDVSAIAAASVVVENVVGFEIARAALDKFAGDTMLETTAALERYLDMARRLPLAERGQ
ncbi:MAG: chorismate synthase [Phycisphaerae bacterium]|nr:chorismate synthase [Phycisphaerae bacterium]